MVFDSYRHFHYVVLPAKSLFEFASLKSVLFVFVKFLSVLLPHAMGTRNVRIGRPMTRYSWGYKKAIVNELVRAE